MRPILNFCIDRFAFNIFFFPRESAQSVFVGGLFFDLIKLYHICPILHAEHLGCGEPHEFPLGEIDFAVHANRGDRAFGKT